MLHLRPIAVLFIAALCFAAGPTLRADDKIDITGKWAGSGTNPQGNTYETTVEITKNGDTYAVKWFENGQEQSSGFGILTGDTFSASYTFEGGHGVVVYKVTKGKLDGKWSLGDGKIYTETLMKK